MTDLWRLSACETVSLVRRREVSAVEVPEAGGVIARGGEDGLAVGAEDGALEFVRVLETLVAGPAIVFGVQIHVFSKGILLDAARGIIAVFAVVFAH